MRVLFFLLIIVAAVSAKLLEQTRYNLPNEALHAAQAENPHVDTFQHTRILFDAVHSGKNVFKTVEKKDEIIGDRNDFKNIASQALFTTTTTGTLFPDKRYFSLDDETVAAKVASMTTDSLVFCALDVKVGDYFIGTSDGKWFAQHATMVNHGSTKGFVFSRQVESAAPIHIGEKSCSVVQTSIVHPIQLVQQTEISSEIQFPFTYTASPGPREHRKLQSFFGTPSKPLLLCNSAAVTDKMGAVSKTGTGSVNGQSALPWSYALDLDGDECVAIEAQVPGSFNWNWAGGSKATKPFVVGSSTGVTCTNCYSFLGQSILAVVNVWGGKLSTFAFEVKRSGGVGFNLALDINNPKISASAYFNLAGASATKTSIPLAYGLALKVGFGGAWATLEGSGSATGRGSFGLGYTFAAEESIKYDSATRWTAGDKVSNVNNLKPMSTITGLKVSTSKFSVIAAISARVSFELGGYIGKYGIAAQFSTVLTSTIQYAHFLPTAKPTAMSLEVAAASASTRALKGMDSLWSSPAETTSRPAGTYYPGDKMSFRVKYENMNPNEDHIMYFNLHKGRGRDSEEGYAIVKHHFRASKTGRGEEHVTWEIPHDSRFTQARESDDGRTHISMHCSSHSFERYHSKQPFKILASRRRERMPREEAWHFPRDGSIVPSGKRTALKWDKQALHSFRPIMGTNGMGSEVIPETINIIIVAEDDNGVRTPYDFASQVPNTGIYEASFPDWLRKAGRRFFAVMHDGKEYSKMDWHHGYFRITAPLSANSSAVAQPVVSSVPPPMVDNDRLWSPPGVAEGPASSTATSPSTPAAPVQVSISSPADDDAAVGTTESVVNSPSKKNLRQLAVTTCKSVISVKLQAQLSFDGLNFLSKAYPVSNAATPPFVILPQKDFPLC